MVYSPCARAMVKRKNMNGSKEDSTMKKNILSLAALLIASAAVFTACSSDDNNVADQGTKTYTLAVQATKDDDATTRALTLGRNDANTKNVLNATWDANEVVLVYQDGSQIGTLYSAASATNETTLTGTLDSAPDADQDLMLYFHTNATPSYAGQDGTLATIASTYDFCAPATITAGSFTVSGSTVSTTSSASFGANQQAIVKFTLIDKADGTTPLSATKLVISVGTTDYTITPTSPTSEIYAAIPGFEGQTVTLTATVGNYTYFYEKTGVSFTNGQYYEIGVKMIVNPVALSKVTRNYHGSVICSDGKAYPPKTAVPDGCTAVGILGEVMEGETVHGLILALQDATPQSSWNTINGWHSEDPFGYKFGYPELKMLPDDDAARGSLTSYTKLGDTDVSNWAVAQKYYYIAIFKNLGSTVGVEDKSYDDNVNAYITTGVGGTELSSRYWSATEATEIDKNCAWSFGNSSWGHLSKEEDNVKIRPVLAF